MKKILLLIFILFCSLIFYQVILGKNGIIAGFQAQQERKILLKYKALLQKKSDEFGNYIQYLKEDENAYLELAREMGFFEEKVELIRFKNLTQQTDFDEDKIEVFFKNYIKKNLEEEKIKKIRLYVSILFYLFFGFFVILILLSGQKDE
ncbi:MAG: hypothetical protein MJB14_03955 [Spirochaetes bacterium]|nr:hypothetical protein [Spirochaetota bacterium]